MAERTGRSSVSKPSAPKPAFGQKFHHLKSAIAARAMSSATDRLSALTDKLSAVADRSGPTATASEKASEKTADGESPAKAGRVVGFEGIKDTVTGVFGGGGKSSGAGKKLKVTNIIEEIDIGAPIEVVYNQWTQFQDWSSFVKKIEDVEQKEEPKLGFKAQVFWSYRSWEGRIVDQAPNERIVWHSKGEKGRVDGAVTFHELAPSLTRVLVVLEYHPQGLFEQTGNLWRAHGRRLRLELNHFGRHVMTQAMLHPDELEGWRGEIQEGEVTRSHEDATRDSADVSDQEDHDEDAGEAENAYDQQAESDEEDDDRDDYDDEDAEEEDERSSGNRRGRRRTGS